MLNSTIFGGYEARSALAEAHVKCEVNTDWCIGGCQSWEETEEGRKRFEAIRQKNQEEKEAGRKHL